jgi:hypothetical protein
MFSCLLDKVFLFFFNKFKPLAGQVNFFSCGFVFGFLELFAADDEQLKSNFSENPKNISKLISNQKSQENQTQALNFLNPLSIKQSKHL